MWTRFMDMHSGGRSKENWEFIYIEAPQAEAEIIFYNRFGHNPHRVSCTCCGEDYSVNNSESLEQTMAYDMGWKYDKEQDKYIPEKSSSWKEFFPSIEEYLQQSKEVLIIRAVEIKDYEREGDLPEQGYVWRD